MSLDELGVERLESGVLGSVEGRGTELFAQGYDDGSVGRVGRWGVGGEADGVVEDGGDEGFFDDG